MGVLGRTRLVATGAAASVRPCTGLRLAIIWWVEAGCVACAAAVERHEARAPPRPARPWALTSYNDPFGSAVRCFCQSVGRDASCLRWPTGPVDPQALADCPDPDARQFRCGYCHVLVVICRRCDRGHRYCGRLCALQARWASSRRACRRYQATQRGARQHAARQRRYRERRAARKVTHAGSAMALPSPTLPAHEDESPPTPSPGGMRPCCICGRPCGPRVRTDRLALCRSRIRPSWRGPPG